MKYIELTQGHRTMVDDDLYEWLNQWKWHYTHSGAKRHTARPNRQAILMHRLINQTPDELVTDHINGNVLDNRRRNLRSCTQAQNRKNNAISSNNTSGYKGVGWHKNTKLWRAYISDNGRQKNLGYFKTREIAAEAYLAAAKEIFGEFMRI